jgi:hypothetical protein
MTSTTRRRTVEHRAPSRHGRAVRRVRPCVGWRRARLATAPHRSRRELRSTARSARTASSARKRARGQTPLSRGGLRPLAAPRLYEQRREPGSCPCALPVRRPGRDVCGSRRSPNRRGEQTVRSTAWARTPFDLASGLPRNVFAPATRGRVRASARATRDRGSLLVGFRFAFSRDAGARDRDATGQRWRLDML